MHKLIEAWLIYNMSAEISPTRHIVSIHDRKQTKREMKKWYYDEEHYQRLKGDKFKRFKTFDGAKNYERKLYDKFYGNKEEQG